MIVIDIDGPSAVGKSSLIRNLQKDLPEAFPIDELLAKKSNPFCNWKTYDDFLQKQLWFFDNTLRRYTDNVSASGPHALQLNDIGVIDVIVHTAVFPLANHLPWSVFSAFREQVRCHYRDLPFASLVLFLYASEEALRLRREQDPLRVRNAFDSNLRLYPLQKDFYFMLAKAFPRQVFCLDAERSPSVLAENVKSVILKNRNEPSLRLYDILDAASSWLSNITS